jgi:hypothetical protein
MLQSSTSSVQDVCTAGIQLLVALYGGKTDDTLATLRYTAYCNASLSRRFQAERLPPSESAAQMHAMRVHFQAVVWGSLGTANIQATDWGWKAEDGKLKPVQIEGTVAPEDVLVVVRCKCKGTCASTACSCRKHGLQCVSACSSCHGTQCSNVKNDVVHDENSDSEPDRDTESEPETTSIGDTDLPDFLWDDDLNFQFEEEV